MNTLDELLERATREHWAIPHCNVATLDQLSAIVSVAERLGSPVMIGTSEGERDFMGLPQAVRLVESYREQGIAAFLNADHTRSVERATEAIDAGYDSVHIDLSKEPFDDNLRGTTAVVDYARASGRAVSIEGEVGYLPTDSSTVLKEAVAIPPESLTKPEEAERFVRETGVNRLAPAIGNLHGIAANEPEIHFELVEQLRATLPDTVALVLHGGSGIARDDMKKTVAAGIANIHISTEIRVAWKKALADSLAASPDEYAPYRLLAPAQEAAGTVVEDFIAICGSGGKV